MNKQDAIERIKNIDTLNVNDNITGQKVDMVIKSQVLEIISKIDEPQKVVVPKFVGEWIETHKRCMPFLSHLFTDNLDEELKEWLDFSDNQNLMAKAWLDGYEVETEKLYTVEIPNPNSAGGKLVLFKQQSTGWLILDMLNPNINKPKYLHLTESEIKQDFDWALKWAVPVEVE